MPSWTIKGETGKALDATARSFAALGAESCSLVFRRLADDELSWFAPADSPALDDLIIPDIGQEVSLWDGATRKFRGHCVAPRATLKGLAVAISGPWWWLRQTPLTQTRADDAGESADRPTYVFAAGKLGGMIRTLVNAANAAGLPVAPVTSSYIPDLYDVPQISLSIQSYADGLSELLAWCPDAVAWFDYATGHDASDNPRLHVSRRGDLPASIYTVGTDPLGDGTALEPDISAQVQQVEVPYAQRLPDGGICYNVESSTRTRAALTTAMTGTNNDITLTARIPGSSGNAITFAIDSAVDNPDLEIKRVGSAITVYRSTSSTTAQEVIDSINTATPQRAWAYLPDKYSRPGYGMTITALEPGPAGNDIVLQFVNGSPLEVSVVGKTITVTHLTSAHNSQIIDALNNDPAASLLIEAAPEDPSNNGDHDFDDTATTANGNAGTAALVVASPAPGNNGAGYVTTLAAASLAGGSNGAGLTPGQWAMVPVSGPELDTSLPDEQREYFNVRSLPTTDFDLHRRRNSRVRSIIEEFGTFTMGPVPNDLAIAVGWRGPAITVRPVSGTGQTRCDYWLVPDTRPPDWAWTQQDQFIFQDLVLTGSYCYGFGEGWSYSGASPLQQAIFSASDGRGIVATGTYKGTWAFFLLETQFIGTNRSWPSTRPLYRPGSWDFIAPPSDLPTNLASAQDWTPWRGTIELLPDAASGDNLLGRKFSVAGSYSPAATAAALAREIAHDFATETTRIQLGAPARHAYRNLITQVRRSGQDNIVWL